MSNPVYKGLTVVVEKRSQYSSYRADPLSGTYRFDGMSWNKSVKEEANIK